MITIEKNNLFNDDLYYYRRIFKRLEFRKVSDQTKNSLWNIYNLFVS